MLATMLASQYIKYPNFLVPALNDIIGLKLANYANKLENYHHLIVSNVITSTIIMTNNGFISISK